MQRNSHYQENILSRSMMLSFYLENPKSGAIERKLNSTKMQYFYFDKKIKFKTKMNEVLNGCLLLGDIVMNHRNTSYDLHQFDFFFLPPNEEASIETKGNPNNKYKICLYYCPIDIKINAEFEIQHYDSSKFIPRGEQGSEKKMATYRTVWTAIKNGYFMSGFTNIPLESLRQGAITSVNIIKNEVEDYEIYPHIHPEYPEVYIMCIDDENYAISQYLINTKGQSVCKDLSDGEGLHFPGYLGHSNFARPFYKNIKYCMYMWMIGTKGLTYNVDPITLNV